MTARGSAGQTTTAIAETPRSGVGAGTDKQPTTLRAFLAESAALLGTVSVLTSLSAFSLQFDLGWLDLYIKAILLAAALIVWLEFHAALPVPPLPKERRLRAKEEWRLGAFTLLMQLLMVGVFVNAISRVPLVIPPLLTVLAGTVVWRLTAHRTRWRYVLVALAVLITFVASEVLLDRLDPPYVTFYERLVPLLTAVRTPR